MKTRGNLIYALVFGAAMAIPVGGNTVTLPSASKTPCFFGAMGSPVECMRMRTSISAGLGFTSSKPAQPIPSALTPIPAVIDPAPLPVSEVIIVVPTVPPKQTAVIPAPRTVPLPLSVLLLLGSIGFMFMAHHKKT